MAYVLSILRRYPKTYKVDFYKKLFGILFRIQVSVSSLIWTGFLFLKKNDSLKCSIALLSRKCC